MYYHIIEHNLQRIQQEMIKNVRYLHVKYRYFCNFANLTKNLIKCILCTEHSKFDGELTNDNINTQAGIFVMMMIMPMMTYDG
jgi:hypothetical protein